MVVQEMPRTVYLGPLAIIQLHNHFWHTLRETYHPPELHQLEDC